MKERFEKSKRIENALQHRLAVAVARGRQAEARLIDLRGQQAALSAQIGTAHGDASRLLDRLQLRLNREVRDVQAVRKGNLADLLQLKQALEAWQRTLTREREELRRFTAQQELSEVVEAMLAIAPAPSLP